MSASNKNLFFRNTSCSVQRFAAWRSGGFLEQKFNRRTALEPMTRPKISLPI